MKSNGTLTINITQKDKEDNVIAKFNIVKDVMNNIPITKIKSEDIINDNIKKLLDDLEENKIITKDWT